MRVTYFQHFASHRHDDFFQPFVPSLCPAQNSMCMCHGSGAVSSLFLVVILRVATVEIHGCRTSVANARRGAERALVEAQTRITQLDQALQQGGRLETASGHLVDTRVLGRPDKWDGSEKAWPNWSFVMKACAGAIDQALSADMTTAECSTDVMSNDTMTGEKKARSVQLYFVCGCRCFHERIQRCFQRFWQEAGLRGSVLVLREERSSSFRLSQEAKGQRQWKVERFQERRQQREEQQGKN